MRQVERIGAFEQAKVGKAERNSAEVKKLEDDPTEVEKVEVDSAKARLLKVDPVERVEQTGRVLVSAPTVAGEAFISLLRVKGVKVAGLTNNEAEVSSLAKLGVEERLLVDTHSRSNNVVVPLFPIDLVCLFERSLPLTSLYIQMCRRFTRAPIVVITLAARPRLIYRTLGATEVIYAANGDALYRRVYSVLTRTPPNSSIEGGKTDG